MRSEVWKIKQIRYAYPVIVAKVFIFGTFFDLKSKKSTSFKDMARINFLVSSFLLFGLNTGKYVPEKNPYLDTFHAMLN